jgi:hypothetical protein
MGTLESQLNGAGRRSLCLTSITFSLRWGEVIVAQQQPGLSGGSGASALARIDPALLAKMGPLVGAVVTAG